MAFQVRPTPDTARMQIMELIVVDTKTSRQFHTRDGKLIGEDSMPLSHNLERETHTGELTFVVEGDWRDVERLASCEKMKNELVAQREPGQIGFAYSTYRIPVKSQIEIARLITACAQPKHWAPVSGQTSLRWFLEAKFLTEDCEIVVLTDGSPEGGVKPTITLSELKPERQAEADVDAWNLPDDDSHSAGEEGDEGR